MLPKNNQPIVPRGSQDNLIQLWHQTKDWERKEGFLYYDRQRERLTLLAKEYKIQTAAVIAAFCALSPNNAESTNYTALRTCLDILAGRIPEPPPSSPTLQTKPSRWQSYVDLKLRRFCVGAKSIHFFAIQLTLMMGVS